MNGEVSVMARIKAALDSDLKPTEKCILVRLIISAGTAGETTWKQETLAERFSVKPRQVRNILSELEEKNWIQTVRAGKKLSNRYRMPWHPEYTSKQVVTGNGLPITQDSDRQPIAYHSEGDRQPSDTVTGNGLPIRPAMDCRSIYEEAGIEEALYEETSSSIVGVGLQEDDDESFSEITHPEGVAWPSGEDLEEAQNEMALVRIPGGLDAEYDRRQELLMKVSKPDLQIVRSVCDAFLVALEKLEAQDEQYELTLGIAIHDWLAERGFGLSQRAKSWALFVADAKNCASEFIKRRLAIGAAEREKVRRSNTPMPLDQAVGEIEKSRQGKHVDEDLVGHLRKRGVEQISVAELKAEESNWNANACPKCGHAGVVGSAARKTLVYCLCQWGEALRAKNPGFVDEQIAAADNLTARLEHAAVEMGKMFTADGIRHSTVIESEGSVTVDIPAEFDLSMCGEDLSAIFKAAGETRELVVIRQREIEPERKHNEFIASLKPRCRCGGTTGLVESQVRRGTWALCECGRATQEQVRECNKRARLGATGFTVGSETQARPLGTESA